VPKIFERNCDFCGDPYKGYGVRFCGPVCSQRDQSAVWSDSPTEPDETLTIDQDGEFGSVVVAASESIKTPDELFERSGLDPDVWEMVPDSGEMRKHDVPMKIATRNERGEKVHKPVIIPCHYVKIRVRMRWESTKLPVPVILKIITPTRCKSAKLSRAYVVFGDEHIPFHDGRNLNLLYQILDIVQPETAVALGDAMDCESLGKWPKDPHNRVEINEEVRMGAEHLGTVHSITPDARHIFHEGNHCQRLQRLVWEMADNRAVGQLLMMPDVQDVLRWPHMLGIEELGWEFIPYAEPDTKNYVIHHDKLMTKHGNFTGPEPGSAARKEYKRFAIGGISGHVHRIGFHHHRTARDQHSWIENPMLGRIRDDYTPHANWQCGLTVIQWADGYSDYWTEVVEMRDGVASFRGRLLRGDSTSFGDLAR
jgi:hypothetical protein